jgi:hypothetical protein
VSEQHYLCISVEGATLPSTADSAPKCNITGGVVGSKRQGRLCCVAEVGEKQPHIDSVAAGCAGLLVRRSRRDVQWATIWRMGQLRLQ